MTTADYLTQLQQDREDLVDNLETKGITGLTGDETFTELVPEVLNIPSGGIPSPDTRASLNNIISTAVLAYDSYVSTIIDDYNSSTQEPITLYTPNIDYQYYVIQKRSNGKYRVDWFKSPRSVDTINIYPSTFMMANSSIQITPYLKISYYGYDDRDISPKDNVYFSSEYDTVEECIQKMKNNEITYELTNNYLAYMSDNPKKVPYTNALIYDKSTKEFITGLTKISSNETIEVIPS